MFPHDHVSLSYNGNCLWHLCKAIKAYLDRPSNHLFCFWPCPSACGILVPQTGTEMPPALDTYSPNHWATRKSLTSPTLGPLFPLGRAKKISPPVAGASSAPHLEGLLPQPRTSFSIQSLSSFLVTVSLSPSPWSLYNHWSPSWPTFFPLTLRINPAWVKLLSKYFNIHWKDWGLSWSSNNLATWCKELTHWKRPWCWERLRTGERDNRGWDGWMAPPTQRTWVWANSRRWWRTGKPVKCCSPWAAKSWTGLSD